MNPLPQIQRPLRLVEGAFLRWSLLLLLCASLCAAIYGQAARFDFLNFDDDIYLSANPWLRGGITLQSLHWAFFANLTEFSPHAEYWSPLTLLSRLADAQFFGMNAGAFHLTNVALHLLNAMLLCAALASLTGSWPRSAMVAILFLAHPLNVEAVCWLSARKDLLSATFFFATLLAYSAYAKRQTMARYCVLLAAFCGALMSKPMAVSIPFVLLVLDGWPLNRWSQTAGDRSKRAALLLEKAPLLLLAAGAACLAAMSQRDWGAIDAGASFTPAIRIQNAVVSYALYLRRIFVPSGLAIFYPHPGASLPFLHAAVAATLLLAVSAAVLLLRRKAPYALSGWLWFGVVLGPVIGLVQVGMQAMADRYAYPSIVGIFVILVWAGADALASQPRLAAAAAACAVLLCSFFSYVQARYWIDSEHVFTHAVQVTQRNDLAYFNLGDTFVRRKAWREARDAFARSAEINPRKSRTWTNLATAEGLLGNNERASADYRQALAIDRRDVRSLASLGLLLAKAGANEEAESLFREAITAEPRWAEPYSYLARLYDSESRWTEEEAAWKAFLTFAPSNTGAQQALLRARAASTGS